MNRLKRPTLVLLVVVVALVAVRYVRHQRDRALALPVIAELGGDVATIPFEPFGTEYRVTFRGMNLTRTDLERLVAINPLASRNWVGISLLDTDITAEDIRHAQEILPNVHVLRPNSDDGEKGFSIGE